MRDDHFYLVVSIFVMGLATYLTRSFSFIFLRRHRKNPRLNFVGANLPAAVVVILVIYCLHPTKAIVYPYGLPELLGVLIVATLHFYKRNTLLSIFGGTAVYLVLIKCVFL